MSNCRWTWTLGWMAALLVPVTAVAVIPTPEELTEARRWTAAKFEGTQAAPAAEPGLHIIANHGPLLRNARDGRKLKVGNNEYARGLYVHAPSKVLVRLPSPGQKLTAVVGIDSNDDTRPGRGSVRFAVRLGEKEVWKSDVLREGMAGVPVQVDLGGASEFFLEVSDGGDGIGWDQSNWADARVALADGKVVWMGDLRLLGRKPYTTDPPFSFTYAGKPFAELRGSWERKHAARKLDDRRTEHTLTWTDPTTKLSVRCVAIEYHDFPTVEWTLHLKNTGTSDTPILERIQALDARVERDAAGEFLLHHNVGSPANGTDYSPVETPLPPGMVKRIGAAGGRPTNSDWSYFNLEWPGEGLIVAVGWPGQWAAELARDKDRGLQLRAGQELTRFKLLPGEEVRSPLIVLQFWKGDWIRAQNVWRRWMMAHSMPKPGGKLPLPLLFGGSNRQYGEMVRANEANQLAFIDRYLEEKIPIDYWWMDAGWYVNKTGWPHVGTWEVDSKRFPRGLRAISDYAHAKGMKTLVWFEPERVAADTWLTQNHPEWVLGGAKGGLLNLGNPDACRWLTDHIDKLLTEQKIDLYRQDFNIDPLRFWRENDAKDRQGITEIKHVTGYLAFWDELRQRHPDMLIDSCASGGRRNDLETMRRAVPLWRSDHAFHCTNHQSMTYGISLWLPYQGTGTVAMRNAPYHGSGWTAVEPYAFWSNAAPGFGLGMDLRVKEIDYATLRRLTRQWREASPNYYGDFYPLTPCTRDDRHWIAWQFDRPEAGEGMVQAFRREQSFYESARFPLHGLDAGSMYQVQDLDRRESRQVSGQELLKTGLAVAIPDRPGAVVITYRKATNKPQGEGQ